jgi:hypothetical protein
MIFVNFKEVLHYLFGGPARERQAQTEEIAHQARQAERLQPLPATTSALVPPIQLSAQPHTRHYTGYSTDNFTTHRGGMDIVNRAEGLQPLPATTSSAPGVRLGLSLTGQSLDQHTSGYTTYSSYRSGLVFGGR